MFSVFKKLKSAKAEDENNGTPKGLQTMSQSLQKKFAKGVQYNMKIVIKGDRNVGKTCLFHRLRGHPFTENYIPTDEIQATSIHWNYKVTDDIVKVEVWDVVDKGKKRVLTDNLKIEQTTVQQQPPLTTSLDAEFIDVYKGTNGVILVMDITKAWTFEYAQRELNKIPVAVPVLILGNHCDMAHHRSVTADQVAFYCESLNRSAPARYAESSMYNGFGLKFLHKWFNVPFLQLQRETLLAQISTNEQEMNVTVQELDIFQRSDDSNYEKFTDKLSLYRRKLAESKSTVPPSSTVIHTQNVHQTAVRKADDYNNTAVSQPASETVASYVKPAPEGGPMPMVNKVYGRGQEIVPEKPKRLSAAEITVSTRLDTSLRNIEEFVPDESLDRSFLEESPSNNSSTKATSRKNDNNHSDSDGESNGNPLVSQLQDDIDPTHEFIPQYITALKIEPEQANRTSKLNDRSFYGENWPDITTDVRPSPDGGEDNNNSSIDTTDDKIEIETKKSEPVQQTISSTISSGSLKKDKSRRSSKTDQRVGDDVHKKDKKKKKSTKKDKQQPTRGSNDELEDFLNCPSGVDAASYYEVL